MSINWKKLFILIGFLGGVILIAYLLYYLFLKPSIPSLPSANVNGQTGALPQAGLNANIPVGGQAGLLPGGTNANIPGPPATIVGAKVVSSIASGGITSIKQLNTTFSYAATIDSTGTNLLYYDKASGQFFRLTPDGQLVTVNKEIFYQVENITWAPDKEKAVLEYPDGANIIYDFATNKQITLPKHWEDFSFSPDSTQLVFKSLGSSEDNRWLAVANADGSQAVKIEHLGDKDETVFPAWSPNNQIIASFVEDKDLDQQTLYFVGLNDENFKTITVAGRGIQSKWSTSGDKLLYSVYSSASDYKPTLWVTSAQGDSIGQNQKKLNLETWADKCTFSDNETVYCAVPRSLESSAGIFSTELDNSPCDIYKIDLKTGLKSLLAKPEKDSNIASLIISQDNRYLYFTDKASGQIYQMKLK